MAFRIPFALQKAIANAIGVDETQVNRIVIDLSVESPPRFRVSGWLTSDQEDQLIRIFEATSFEEKAAR